MDQNRIDNVVCTVGLVAGIPGANFGDISGIVSAVCSAICAAWGLIRLGAKLWQAWRNKRLAKTLDEIAKNLDETEDEHHD